MQLNVARIPFAPLVQVKTIIVISALLPICHACLHASWGRLRQLWLSQPCCQSAMLVCILYELKWQRLPACNSH